MLKMPKVSSCSCPMEIQHMAWHSSHPFRNFPSQSLCRCRCICSGIVAARSPLGFGTFMQWISSRLHQQLCLRVLPWCFRIKHMHVPDHQNTQRRQIVKNPVRNFPHLLPPNHKPGLGICMCQTTKTPRGGKPPKTPLEIFPTIFSHQTTNRNSAKFRNLPHFSSHLRKCARSIVESVRFQHHSLEQVCYKQFEVDGAFSNFLDVP